MQEKAHRVNTSLSGLLICQSPQEIAVHTTVKSIHVLQGRAHDCIPHLESQQQIIKFGRVSAPSPALLKQQISLLFLNVFLDLAVSQ